jgi:hypothetical protein
MATAAIITTRNTFLDDGGAPPLTCVSCEITERMVRTMLDLAYIVYTGGGAVSALVDILVLVVLVVLVVYVIRALLGR